MSGMIQYLRELHFASVVVRLALAMLLGGCIGLERGRKRVRPVSAPICSSVLAQR